MSRQRTACSMFLRNTNKIYVIAAIIICVGGLCLWFFRSSAPKSDSSKIKNSEVSRTFKTVKVGDAVIRAELAVTGAQQIQGLSDKAFLDQGSGMFFVFDHLSNWGIWMKDMNFPIDVLWITDDLKVVDIVENMSPASYPKVYVPHAPARYVLEVPAGTVKDYEIMVGQDVVVI